MSASSGEPSARGNSGCHAKVERADRAAFGAFGSVTYPSLGCPFCTYRACALRSPPGKGGEALHRVRFCIIPGSRSNKFPMAGELGGSPARHSPREETRERATPCDLRQSPTGSAPPSRHQRQRRGFDGLASSCERTRRRPARSASGRSSAMPVGAGGCKTGSASKSSSTTPPHGPQGWPTTPPRAPQSGPHGTGHCGVH